MPNVESLVENILFDVHNKKQYRTPLLKLLVNEILGDIRESLVRKQCPYCGKQFITFNALKSHIVVNHRHALVNNVSIVVQVYRHIKSRMLRGSSGVSLCIGSIDNCVEEYRFRNIESMTLWLKRNKGVLSNIISIALKNS